eukprot:jgi/Antlo1/1709/1567
MEKTNTSHSCPGVQSERAGRDKACEGCPNATYCSQPRMRDPFLDMIDANLSNFRLKISVMSGKGGVGKSTICRSLAEELSSKVTTCIFDLDISGSSIPKLTSTEVCAHVHNNKIYPVKVSERLYSISLANLETVSCLDSLNKTVTIKKMLSQTDFSGMEILVFDTPPGVSDEHLALVNYVNVDSTIIVTTPHVLSLNDVKRQIDFCRKAKFPILGVVSNMDGFFCKCGHLNKLFVNDVSSFCKREGVCYIGAITLRQEIAKASDAGLPFGDPLIASISKLLCADKLEKN